jgi:putative ABC transport system permease protein
VNGHAFTIVGVTPRGFTGTTLGDDPDVFVPISFQSRLSPGWDGTTIYVFARLKPRLTRLQAETRLNSVYAGLVEEPRRFAAGTPSTASVFCDRG